MSRVTQGVKLINLREGQKVSTVSVVDQENDVEQLVESDNTEE